MKRLLRVIALAAVLMPTAVQAQVTPGTMTLKDGNGASKQVRTDVGSDQSVAVHNVPETDGIATGSAHPMPSQDTAAESSLSTIAGNTTGNGAGGQTPWGALIGQQVGTAGAVFVSRSGTSTSTTPSPIPGTVLSIMPDATCTSVCANTRWARRSTA